MTIDPNVDRDKRPSAATALAGSEEPPTLPKLHGDPEIVSEALIAARFAFAGLIIGPALFAAGALFAKWLSFHCLS